MSIKKSGTALSLYNILISEYNHKIKINFVIEILEFDGYAPLKPSSTINFLKPLKMFLKLLHRTIFSL